jgi:hypothetical protein
MGWLQTKRRLVGADYTSAPETSQVPDNRHLQDTSPALRTKGANLRATEQPIDTGTAAGKCFLDMLGVFAEFVISAFCHGEHSLPFRTADSGGT